MKKIQLCIILLFLAANSQAQQIIPLYAGDIPNATTHPMQEIASEKGGRILWHHKVPAELHLHPIGNHGFVLKLLTEEWMVPLFTWMRKNEWVR